MKKTHLILAIIIFFFPLVSTVQAALISNGSFESGTADPGGSLISLEAGASGIDAWTIGLGGVDYIGGHWSASDGKRSIDLNLLESGEISQTFATVAGQRYKILFDLAGNPDNTPKNKAIQVGADSKSQSFGFNAGGKLKTAMGWTEKSFEFTASGSEATLTFTSLTSGPYGPAIDNVRVDAVPIPCAVWLLGSGLICIVGKKSNPRQ